VWVEEKGVGKREWEGTGTSASTPCLGKQLTAMGRSSAKTEPRCSVFVGSTKLPPPFARARLITTTTTTPPYPTPKDHPQSM
jgi:hypothetical protein